MRWLCMSLGWWLMLLAWCICGAAPLAAECIPSEFQNSATRLPREELQAAMQKEVAKGYNLLVSTQAGRFTSAVLLDLARAVAADSAGRFMLHHDDWYEAFRVSMSLDSAAMPEYVDLQRVHHQNKYFHVATGVEAEEGPPPLTVLRVWSGWSPSPEAATEYTFVDTAASPDMEVTNENCISYWLVDYGDIVMNDRIFGLRGRPLEGALGVAFNLVGAGRAEWSRSIVAEDGAVVTWSKAERGPFAARLITTTLPSGRLVKGLPENRPDLKALEKRLKQSIQLRYPEPASR